MSIAAHVLEKSHAKRFLIPSEALEPSHSDAELNPLLPNFAISWEIVGKK